MIPEHWTFRDEQVADTFDAHVREQLPWYDLATDAVASIARHYVGAGGLVYDVGASTGNIGRAIADTLDERHANLIAIEESPEMARRYVGPGTVVNQSATAVDFEPFDFGVCFLVLMFLRVDERGPLLRRMVEAVRPGGAIVVVERTLPTSPYLGLVSHRMRLAAKVRAGVSGDDIVAKELSLGGVQRPLDAATLDELGAAEFFRFGDFAGWVIEP